MTWRVEVVFVLCSQSHHEVGVRRDAGEGEGGRIGAPPKDQIADADGSEERPQLGQLVAVDQHDGALPSRTLPAPQLRQGLCRHCDCSQVPFGDDRKVCFLQGLRQGPSPIEAGVDQEARCDISAAGSAHDSGWIIEVVPVQDGRDGADAGEVLQPVHVAVECRFQLRFLFSELAAVADYGDEWCWGGCGHAVFAVQWVMMLPPVSRAVSYGDSRVGRAVYGPDCYSRVPWLATRLTVPSASRYDRPTTAHRPAATSLAKSTERPTSPSTVRRMCSSTN